MGSYRVFGKCKSCGTEDSTPATPAEIDKLIKSFKMHCFSCGKYRSFEYLRNERIEPEVKT